MGILGLTEQYVHDKISFTNYEEKIQTYKDEIPKFNIIPQEESMDPLSDESALNCTPLNPDDHSIKFQNEFHLMLLRHWSLYDSLYHSTYVATRLGIWKDKGRQKLSNLIANTGLPLTECYQSYASMRMEFKRDISPKLKKWAPRFNMPEIIFPSFLRNCGSRTAVSASDTIYSLTALMDCGSEWIRKHSSTTVGEETLNSSNGRMGDQNESVVSGRKLTGVGSGTRTGIAAFNIDPLQFDFDDTTQEEDSRKRWTSNFYIAYDALSK